MFTFYKLFIDCKTFASKFSRSKLLHVQDDESDNDIDEDRNSDNDVIDEELKNEVIHDNTFSQDLPLL